MKKILSILILALGIFLINSNVYAEKCKVISGTGKQIGDEIACGTEHFYIMSNDGENIKMMAKYNLYVGTNWDKTILENTYYNTDTKKYNFNGEEVNNYQELKSLINNKLNLKDSSVNTEYIGKEYYGNYGYYQNLEESKNLKVYMYENINEDTEGYALQNEKALGVTGKQGNANYPINATIMLFDYDNNTEIFQKYINNLNNFENGYTNYELNDDNETKIYLNTYQEKLTNLGFTTNNVDIISISELNEFVKNITNEELPLSEWYNNSNNNYDEDYGYTLGDLKEFLSEEYSWIWNTSYWTKTLNGNNISTSAWAFKYYNYFISSQGTICYDESSCSGSIPRAGIRPIVTMPSNQVYDVQTKDDSNGTVEYEYKDGLVFSM